MMNLTMRMRSDRAENSIMQTITIAVSAILVAAGLVTAPGLINNARDNNAREDIKNIAYAQGVYESEFASYTPDLETLRNQEGKVKITGSAGTDGSRLIAGYCSPTGASGSLRPKCVEPQSQYNITNYVNDPIGTNLSKHQFNTGVDGSILANAVNGHSALRATKKDSSGSATAIYYQRNERFAVPENSIGVTYSGSANMRSSKAMSVRLRLSCNASSGASLIGITSVDLKANEWTVGRVDGVIAPNCNSLSLDMVTNGGSPLTTGDTYDMTEVMLVKGKYTGPFVYAGTPGWVVDASGISSGPVPASDYISPDANPGSYGASDCFAVFIASKSGATFYSYSGQSGVFKIPASTWPLDAPNGYPSNCEWPTSRASVTGGNILSASVASGDAELSSYPVLGASSYVSLSKESNPALVRSGQSLKVVVNSNDGSYYGPGPRTADGEIEGGKTYNMEVWVRTTETTSVPVNFLLSWKNRSGQIILDTYTQNTIKDTDGWKRISTSFTAPAGSSYLYIPVLIQSRTGGGAGTVYLDDWSITRA